MCIKLGKITVYISVPAAAFIAFASNFTSGRIYVTALITMFMHELTHIVFLFLFGCRDACLKINPGGIKLSASGLSSLSYRQMIGAALCAPVMNILTGAAALILFPLSEAAHTAAWVNFSVGGVNLIPLKFTDGGRALSSYLLRHKNIDRAEEISSFISALSVIFMFSVFFVFAVLKKNFFFFLFFAVYCFSELVAEKHQS